MLHLFSTRFCRFLATVLLVLDLSQEPLSALPAPTPGDGDDDMVTEITTREDIWFFGSARTGHEFNLALAVERASASADQLPSLGYAPCPPAAEPAKAVAIQQAPDHHPALSLPAHFACPEPPSIQNVRAFYLPAPHHRNTSLGHRASVLLLI